ncbi:MAG: DUF982 domain-containing protein [Phyllobacterium sp.]|uniref:DUF982 domain-containing protein n=1 Tax=Phyllobacterium sp. TaxID=1871046 RepID=UPI0030EFF43E
MVRVFGRKPGQLVAITSAYDAAMFLLQEWPDETGPKHLLAREIMLKCLAGDCSPAVARVAFVEAAREANIYMETPIADSLHRQPDPTWGKRQTTLAKHRRPKQP